MFVFTASNSLRAHLDKARERNVKIGIIPTMGALHEGHFSLMQTAINGGFLPVVSIFVNPAQFNDIEDYEKYPSTIPQDLQQLYSMNIDAVYIPAVEEVYPRGWKNLENYDLGELEKVFEGAQRPGHFQGVCQILHRLFNLVMPDTVFMGQKDYQQCMVVSRLLEIMQSRIKLEICPTVREASGLAKSSRNLRLSDAEKENAASLYKNMTYVKTHLQPGNEMALLQIALNDLKLHGFNMEYLSLANAKTLMPVERWDGTEPLVLLAAGKMGSVRLIDNLLI